MSATHTFTTAHMWHNSIGSECECEVEVTYAFHRGFPQTMIDPGEPDSVEVISVIPVVSDYDPGEIDLDAFSDECMADYQDHLADVAERRADMRRDDYHG